MRKMMLVAGMAVAIMLTGCGQHYVDTSNTQIESETEEFSSPEAEFVSICYPAVECILGEEIRQQEVRYDDEGFWIDERFISFDEIDEHCSVCGESSCR